MEFTAENIEKAVLQFYADFSNQGEMNRWLTTAQVSPQAWHFCWQLMVEGKSAEVQFFGASCLHVKISRYWNEIPETHLHNLRSQLCSHITRFAAGPRIVLTRLAVALASFVLHTIGDVWPDAIAAIITSFQPAALPHLQVLQPNNEYRLLLELLTIIPEEFNTAQLVPQRKAVVRTHMHNSVSQVLTLLHRLLSDGSGATEQREQALRCISSWVQFGVSVVDVEPCALLAFEALQLRTLLQAAVDTLVNIFSHPSNHRYPSHIWKLFPHVLQLEPMLQHAKEDGDTDTCQYVIQLLVAIADHNTKLLLEASLQPGPHRQMALTMVNLILQCTAMPGFYPVDECCSDLPFGFWYNFQDDIIASEIEQYNVLVSIYSPVYLDLVDVLLKKSQFPPIEEYDSWLADEKEAHRCYRQDIADTLMYAYNLIHDVLLAHFTQLLASVLERTRINTVSWQELEAVLFGIASIAESVQSEEVTYLPQLFAMLSHMPYNNSKVVAQALDLVGSYAEWINVNPSVLVDVMPLLLQGLEHPELSQSATLALKEVVCENQKHLQPFATTILQASKKVLDSRKMNNRDMLRLMACVGYVLAVLPVADTVDFLNVVLAPQMQQLQQLATQQPSPSSKVAIQFNISLLSWLFSSLSVNSTQHENQLDQSGSQPVLLVMKQVLPVLPLVLQNWISDVGIVENLCDMLKKTLRALLNDFDELSTDISQLTIEMYNAAPQPAILDLAKQLLIWFKTDVKYHSLASHLFLMVCRKTNEIFHTGNIQDKTDIVEAFMAFLAQITKKSVKLLANEECNQLQLFQSGLTALGMHEYVTVKAACQFLSELITNTNAINGINEIVNQHGQELVEKLIKGISGEFPRTTIEPIADVFLALNKHHTESLNNWLNAVVTHEAFPTHTATVQQRRQFASRVLKERANKRRMKETLEHFALLWRGMLGTEYAAHTRATL